MDAALAQLRERGVLAGLNLREIADAVGVTPANIYYYFGDRQGLLRAAIGREVERLAEPMASLDDADLAQRRGLMFDAILELPMLPMSALLALDGDPDYEPLPFLDSTRDHHDREVASGGVSADVDLEAVHLVSLATSIGVAIYAEAVARQIGVERSELVARARAVLVQMIDAAVRPAEESTDPS